MKKKPLALCLAVALSLALRAQSWTPLSVGVSTDVLDMSFPSDDTGFVSLGNGTMKKTVDGGLNWSGVSVPVGYNGPLEFLSGTTGLILSDSGILRTINCGGSWSVMLSNPNVSWRDIHFISSNVGYAAGPTAFASSDSVFVYKTVNGGVTWNICTIIHDWGAQVPILNFRTSLEGYLFGGDSIHRTADGGVTWTGVYSDPGGAFISTLSAPDPTTAYCTDMNSMEIVKSVNGGTTWSPTGQFMGNPAWGSYFINASFGFMCGGNGINAGYIAQTINGGSSWTSPVIGSNTFWCMDFPSMATGYCGGTAGVIMKYSGPLSIQDNSFSSIRIYPNPATDIVTIDNSSANVLVTIRNCVGQAVKTEVGFDRSIQIDIADLPAGVYFCEIASANIKMVERIVVE